MTKIDIFLPDIVQAIKLIESNVVSDVLSICDIR